MVMDGATGPPGSIEGVVVNSAVKVLNLGNVSGTVVQPAMLLASYAVAAVVFCSVFCLDGAWATIDFARKRHQSSDAQSGLNVSGAAPLRFSAYEA